MRHFRVSSISAAAALALIAISAGAQSLTKIGATSAGTPVMLEPKSVAKANGIITATLRVGLQPPIKTTNGDMVSMRTIMMFDCAKQTSATKERWFYFDDKFKMEARHDKPGIPGYGPALKGSVPDVGLAHFCAPGAKP